jgi:catechol 2,3-dioxygenase-like lactoylglutathione lyase family enzyme
MAFIRHVAIASKDPAGTAEFYKKHFDLKELYRQPKETGDDGVWLSDGYIYFAILKHGPNTPRYAHRLPPPLRRSPILIEL